MLEVKNNQLFECVEKQFSTDLFHRICGKLFSKKNGKVKSEKASNASLFNFSTFSLFHFETLQLSAFFGFLQIVESLLQNRARAFAAVHFADVAFAYHRV